MIVGLVIAVALTFASSTLLTLFVRKHALRIGMLDIPNSRSSHATPTPRGGGVAIVVATSLGMSALSAMGLLDTDLLTALLGGLLIASVGYLDDRHSLPVGTRLVCHFGAAVWAISWIGEPPSIQFAQSVVHLGWIWYVLGVLVIVWVLNLFNFMDGIDGLAATEGAFIATAAAGLAISMGAFTAVSAVALVLAASCLGFLVWNWPPAKIFMGDVGSGYVGYTLAVLCLGSMESSPTAVWTWISLGALFVVDTTVTFARRLARGERVHEAHRSHAYQRLSRIWNSHLRVTNAFLAINMLWLLPLAFLGQRLPAYATWLALVSILPLILLALMIGAGSRDVEGPANSIRGR